MAYETGTAAGHKDLLAKIKTFVTSTGTMGAGNEWAILRDDTASSDHELILKGPGISGTDEIFVGLKTYDDAGADYYNFKVDGMTGYVSGNSFETQPGSAGVMGVPLFNSTMPYWIYATAQVIVVGAKVETIYETFYLGFINPYMSPDEFPYPLAVIAPLPADSATRYSDTAHGFGYRGESANCKLRMPDGLWVQPQMWPFSNQYVDGSHSSVRDTGGGYPALHLKLWSDSPANHFGELDGVMWVSGFNNVVENTMTVNGDGFVVLRDTWRTGFSDYVAQKVS